MPVDSEAIAVIGAGGHAKVVLSTLAAAGATIGELFDEDDSTLGRSLLGFTVAGAPAKIANRGYQQAIIAVGENRSRQALAHRLSLQWIRAVHPKAIVHESVRLGPGTAVFAGAVIQPDVQIGSHVIVNTAASVDHDCRIEGFSHIAPGARLAGNVEIGEGVLVGIGATVAPGVRIGDWATVGAGAVVLSEVGSGATVVGVPARPVPSGSRS